jgi:hypothetical protein
MSELIGQDRWRRILDLFDRLLAGENPQFAFSAESDLEVRQEAIRLWEHHLAASADDFLESKVQFSLLPVFEPGQVLGGRFRIERLLGAGGMGEVYLAWDNRMNEAVALKTLTRLFAPSPALRRRIVAEVQSARPKSMITARTGGPGSTIMLPGLRSP